MPNTGKDILNIIREQIDLSDYRKVHWEGTFEEYLDIVRDHPDVTRTAYQRLYDMILSHGFEARGIDDGDAVGQIVRQVRVPALRKQ